VVAHVEGKVRISGGKVPVVWNLEAYRRLRQELPGERIGPYWIVRDSASLVEALKESK